MGVPQDVSWMDEYYNNPDSNVLRDLYSSCDFWFAPTTSEGFHNVAAEAGLCGCMVIANDSPHSGMQDYIGDFKYHTIEDAANMIRKGYSAYINELVEIQKKIRAIGNREENMRKFICLLS